MTTPTPDSFEYNDDSVIARVAFDIPPSTITDISQITQAMAAMRTELESIARAQSDWLDYLGQVPQIAERANQAYRDSITQMERIAYIQSEIGPSPMGGGPVGYAGGGGAAGGGVQGVGGSAVGGYSTAAPAGYANPFQGMMEGTGRGANRNGVNEQLAALAKEDPRVAANMVAARGMAVNPAMLGMIGGVMGAVSGLGTGADAPGNMSPQPTGAARTSSQPPSQSAGGAPVGSAPQNVPGPPTQDDPWWRHFTSGVFGEIQKGMGGSRVGQILGSALPGGFAGPLVFGNSGTGGGGVPPVGGGGTPPGGPTNPYGGSAGGGGAGGGGGGGVNPASGAAGGGLMKMAMDKIGPKGLAAAGTVGALGLGVAGYNVVQNIGERMTRLQALGSEEGGDYMTGLKEELHSRMIGLDPFISTGDARKATQLTMSAGFQGESRDELRDLLINNFKELGVSMADSMTIEMANMRGKDLTDKNVLESRSSNEATMNVMKELSGAGGNTMALSERIEELKKLSVVLNSLGSSQENIERSAVGWQAGYGDSLALRGSGSKIMGQTMGSGTLMSLVGARAGVTGYLPNALPAALEEAGLDDDEITEMAAQEAAKFVSGLPKKLNRIAAFQSLMQENGVELDWPQAKDLYERVSGEKGELPSKKANKTVARQGKPGTGDTGGMMTRRQSAGGPGQPGYDPSENAERVEDSFERAGRIPGDNFAPAGQKGRPMPVTASQMPATITTNGQVTGEVRIVVDSQGRVTAPPVISLSGQSKAVNAGYGAATLNNPPPGDPSSRHAYTAFSGG